MRTAGNDRGAVRASYITKLAVALAIIGVLGYDSVAVIATRISTEGDASNVANLASENWQNTKNVTDAYAAAVQAAAPHHETVLKCSTCFSIDQDNTVHVELTRTAHTLVFAHVGFLRHYTLINERGSANYDPP
jgi:hypothetical protein